MNLSPDCQHSQRHAACDLTGVSAERQQLDSQSLLGRSSHLDLGRLLSRKGKTRPESSHFQFHQNSEARLAGL